MPSFDTAGLSADLREGVFTLARVGLLVALSALGSLLGLAWARRRG